MIDDLDEALRQLLIAELPIVSNEVDIAFEPPTRDWSARLSRPTLNLFMHDLRENNKLRTQQPYLGVSKSGNSATISPNSVRLDVHYMATAWANDPSDEHRLLTRALMVFYRYQVLPEQYLSGQLESQDYDIWLKIAQYDQRDLRREIWSVLDNVMRPIVDLTITLAIEPHEEWTVPLVRETSLGFGQFSSQNLSSTADFGGGSSFTFATNDQFYTVSGLVQSGEPLRHLSVQLLEIAVPVTIYPSGHYVVQNLRAGDYTLLVSTGEGEPTMHSITVPSSPSEYDIFL
jgi:hypothetical protein